MALAALLFLVNFCLICCSTNTVRIENKNLEEGSPCIFDDGSVGVCGKHCLRLAYLNKNLKICALKETGVIACCRNSTVNSEIPKIYPTLVQVCRERRVDSKGQPKGLEHMKQEANPTERIATNLAFYSYTSSGEFPHASALGWRTPTDGETEWNCGGSLIHPEYVLTAAHCVTNMESPPSTVRISATDLKNPMAPDGRNFTIKKVYLHPKYKPDLYYNDIAILKLSERYEGPVACIWPRREMPNGLTAIGYGAPDFGRTSTNRLLKIKISVVSTKECREHYVGDSSLPDGIVDSQICAQDPEGYMDTCQGDSGGPLQFGEKFIVGIISFGKKCSSGIPGVYTRVSSYLDWIEEVIRN